MKHEQKIKAIQLLELALFKNYLLVVNELERLKKILPLVKKIKCKTSRRLLQFQQKFCSDGCCFKKRIFLQFFSKQKHFFFWLACLKKLHLPLLCTAKHEIFRETTTHIREFKKKSTTSNAKTTFSYMYSTFCIADHSSEIRGLCLKKCPSKTLQNLPYFIHMYENLKLLFPFFISCNFIFPLIIALVYGNIGQGIREGKK